MSADKQKVELAEKPDKEGTVSMASTNPEKQLAELMAKVKDIRAKIAKTSNDLDIQ